MARLASPPAFDPCTSTPAKTCKKTKFSGLDCCDGLKSEKANFQYPTLESTWSGLYGQICHLAGLLRTTLVVALSGAFLYFIIQACMITVTMCQSVKTGLTTAATGISYMGLWTLMIHFCQWAMSMVELAPGLPPIASALHGFVADSMGFGQPLVVQPTLLSYSGLSAGTPHRLPQSSELCSRFQVALLESGGRLRSWELSALHF